MLFGAFPGFAVDVDAFVVPAGQFAGAGGGGLGWAGGWRGGFARIIGVHDPERELVVFGRGWILGFERDFFAVAAHEIDRGDAALREGDFPVGGGMQGFEECSSGSGSGGALAAKGCVAGWEAGAVAGAVVGAVLGGSMSISRSLCVVRSKLNTRPRGS